MPIHCGPRKTGALVLLFNDLWEFRAHVISNPPSERFSLTFCMMLELLQP